MKPFKNYILPLLLLLVFTGSKAQILYNRAFGTSSGDVANDIIIGSDTNYIILGRYYQNIYLAKADTIGQLIWEKSYFIPSINTQPNSLSEIGDTSFVIGGVVDNKGYLLKVNVVGDSLYNNTDTTIVGNNVSNLRVAPDGNLLALVTFNGIVSLVKFDDELNVINTINNIVPTVKDIEVINNNIYLLKEDSLDNLLIVNNDLNQIDTIDIPLYPFYFNKYLRISFDRTQLIVDGYSVNSVLSPRKRYYTNLFGNIEDTCDSLNLYFTDFQTIDFQNDIVYAGVRYDATWGTDIRLYFINNQCEQVVKDTILYRGGDFSDPKRDENVVKLLIDQNGNYVLFGNAEKGPLGDWDILFAIYKKWDGFPTSVEETDNDKLTKENTIVIYPNPTQNQFTITGIQENSSITILDVMGKVAHYIPNTTHQTQINTTNWAKGLYIVQLKGNQSSTTLKVIKQ